MALTGCSKDMTDTEDNTISDVSSEDNNSFTEAKTEIDFKGISSKVNTPELGNLSGSLNNNGYICSYNETLFFRNVNGNEHLYRKDKDGEKTRLIEKKAFSINVLEEHIYFISEDDNNAICRIDLDGGNFTLLSEDTSYQLIVSKECIYYTNEKGNLYQLSLDGKETKLISDDQCAWPNIYRDYIIYTSFADKRQLVGININTGERIQIAEYGFYPVVYEDTLFFQDKKGNINVMDIRTGESLAYINQWGQRICPTKAGVYFTNTIDVFYYENASKELQTIPIASPDPRHEITVHTNVELLYGDEDGIYYLLRTGDKTALAYLNIQTGNVYRL
jgi:hypothetical protein